MYVSLAHMHFAQWWVKRFWVSSNEGGKKRSKCLLCLFSFNKVYTIVILWCFEHALCGVAGFETSSKIVLNSMRGQQWTEARKFALSNWPMSQLLLTPTFASLAWDCDAIGNRPELSDCWHGSGWLRDCLFSSIWETVCLRHKSPHYSVSVFTFCYIHVILYILLY